MIFTGSRKTCFSFGIFLDRNAVSLRYHRVPFDEQLAPPVAPGIDSALIVDRMPDYYWSVAGIEGEHEICTGRIWKVE
jgi:hypothetical protein